MTLIVKALVIFAFLSLAGGFILMLPNYEMPEALRTGVTFMITASMWANTYIALTTAIQIFGWSIVLEIVIWMIRNISRWLDRAAQVLS